MGPVAPAPPSFTPRPSQQRILAYERGKLGISAVPGSGKTHTLSALAARIIDDRRLGPEQEVLIVTLVNSAVDNFAARISAFLGEDVGLIPRWGYRVRTLHGLAHDIVREDPPLVGLDKQFSIVDETASANMIREAARAWAHLHPDTEEAFLAPGLEDAQRRRIAQKDWPELVESLAGSFIRSAKDRRLAPDQLRRAAAAQATRLPLVDMGLQVYADYQRALTYRGAVDFDDLIRLAADMLDASAELLERLRYRWPYVLEDEAQDSSKIQQHIIAALVGEDGNWVRVGDPNQAIFETFTTANPELLLQFIHSNESVDMPESGRSQASIQHLANFLIDWTLRYHPVVDVRGALRLPKIVEAPPGDPQPNPPDDPGGIQLWPQRLTPEEEVAEVVKSLENWLPDHPDRTVAVLSSTNDHAAHVVRALQARGIAFRELLRSTSPTRAAVGSVSHVLGYLSQPDSASKLAQAYRVWRRDWRDEAEREPLVARTAAFLAKLKNLEQYLAPTLLAASSMDAAGFGPVTDALPGEPAEEVRQAVLAELRAFQETVALWHGATVLPIDQLVLTISQDIFKTPADLALAHKLALVLRQLADENPRWRIPELTAGLRDIARNAQRFIGFSADDEGFDPDKYPGVVVVSTLHKAKGLEWDRVYLLSVNTYDFPSAAPGDRFIAEKWFLRDGLNLEAEALGQLRAATATGDDAYYQEGAPTLRARIDYARERLRLLYVGMTRARRELILSWNTGRRGDAEAALAFTALQAWWELQHAQGSA